MAAGAEGSAWSPEGFEEVLLAGVGWERKAGLRGTESQVGWEGRGQASLPGRCIWRGGRLRNGPQLPAAETQGLPDG